MVKQSKPIRCQRYFKNDGKITDRCSNEATQFFICTLNPTEYKFEKNKAICQSCYNNIPDHKLDVYSPVHSNVEVSRQEFLKHKDTVYK